MLLRWSSAGGVVAGERAGMHPQGAAGGAARRQLARAPLGARRQLTCATNDNPSRMVACPAGTENPDYDGYYEASSCDKGCDQSDGDSCDYKCNSCNGCDDCATGKYSEEGWETCSACAKPSTQVCSSHC